ncbi:MAG TPA: sulfurtransferase-like selenium metabolism protein YedF [Thermoflexia bacterium]|jgi:selenium metabolism protein YedF|nr:sulfurtransferase-like selenium metabolism protein YedF [Thermoflexia bacterium]
MAVTVDARGLPCPQPVILTRNALRESVEVITIVDNDTARHNVLRMAQKEGCTVEVEEKEDGIYLHITRGEMPREEPAPQAAVTSAAGSLVLVVPSEFMGRGEHEELGRILVRGFFHTLGEVEPLPDTIIFFNSGVKLVVEGSPVVEDLKGLAERGVEILACGTCLGYYELKDKVAVGEVSNMYTIAETLLRAGKVVSL